MKQYTITVTNNFPTEGFPAHQVFKTDAFLVIAENEEEDRTDVAGELPPDFLQELLILNPIERFAAEYEKAKGKKDL